MISEFKELEKLFQEIDQQLKTEVKIYIIGGAALLYHDLKPATKDIDIIAVDENEYNAFKNVLKSIGFKIKTPAGVYIKMNLSSIFEREDFRVDMFLKTVCKKLCLSNKMEKRAINVINLKNLKVFLCSNEDIFIFKSLTEREGDLEDNISLIKHGLNWDIILDEIIFQIKTNGQDVWITWFGERLDKLEEQGVNIPFMDKINKLRDEYFKKIERKLNK